jgi:hypothetical protein
MRAAGIGRRARTKRRETKRRAHGASAGFDGSGVQVAYDRASAVAARTASWRSRWKKGVRGEMRASNTLPSSTSSTSSCRSSECLMSVSLLPPLLAFSSSLEPLIRSSSSWMTMLPSDEAPPGRTDLTVSVVWGVTPTSSPSCLRRPMPKPPATSARWTQGEVMDLERKECEGLVSNEADKRASTKSAQTI